MRSNVHSVIIYTVIIYSVCSLGRSAAKGISGCIVPSEPDHGDYITDNMEASPGDVLASVRLVYICEEGYELVGPYSVSCNDGVWSETPHVPDCIHHCSIENGTSIVTCGADETRCSIPQTFTKQTSGLPQNRLSGESCGTVSHRQPVIAGGAPARIQDMPWHAGVYTKTTTPYKQICGGTLISHRVVVSAAHCFWSDVEKLLPASNYAVAVGKRYRPWADIHDESQHSDISEIKVPPRYHGGRTNFQDDLALLVLTSPVEFSFYVNPVCLDFDHQMEGAQLQPGNLGKVGGWGLTAEDGKASQMLKAVQMPYVPVERCIAESPPEFLSSITSDKICAGYKNGTAVCKGDSGGGLVFPAVDRLGFDRYYLRGVVSTAPSGGHLCNVHAWATFTLISKHERFIKDIIEE